MELWGSLSDTKLDHLQHPQRTWLSVLIMIKYDKAVMTYKILNNLCPGSLHGNSP